MKHDLFGTKHILLMIAALAIVAIGYFFARKLKFEKITKIMLCLGVVSEIVKIFYYIIANEKKTHGVLPKTDLPFHLCSIQILFILAVYFLKNEKVKNFLISFIMPSCLIGGFAALLIATESALNGTWVITAQYFIYHAAIMIYALYLATNKEYGPTLKGYFSCLKMLFIMMFFAIYINSMLSDGETTVNFMYVVAPPAKNLPFLNDENGWFSYIFKYAVLIVVCVSLFYAKPLYIAIKEKIAKLRKKNTDAEAELDSSEEA